MRAGRAGLFSSIWLFWLLAEIAWAAPARFVIVDVIVNGVAQTPAMIALAADGAILARRADAAAWNLDLGNAPAETLNAILHVRLSAMPGIKVRFDQSTLTIDAAEAAFTGTRIDLQKKTAPTLDTGSGAYANYDLSWFGGRGQRAVSAAAVEGVFYSDALSFASNGVYSSAGMPRRFVRYESSLHWDFPDNMRSLVVGDAISRSGALPRSFRFGGISYGTNFATRPDLVTFPLPAVPGESRIPTAAELLINGQTHARMDLAPGPFEISNVPAINGAGEIQLVTRDPLGRQQVLVVPYYVTPALLRAGLTDSGFEMGKVREDFGLENFRYGRGFARGMLRYGITPGLTGEVFAETAGGKHLAAAGATAAINNFAIATATVAISEGASTGTSLSASLERASREFSFGLRGQVASRHFTQLGELDGLHTRFNANAGFSLGAAGSMSLIHVAESRYDRGRIATSAVSYQKQIGKTLSLLANVSVTRSNDGLRHYAGLAFAMPLDALASASLSSSRQDGIAEHVLDVRQNLPLDHGWAVRGRISDSDATRRRLDAGLTWQNAFGQWSADASHAGSSQNFRLGMNGSVVSAGGLTRAVRQLGDAFAIVSVPGFPDIDVYHENQRVAHTDAAGFAIVPRLRPFEPNAISLDTLKLSMSTELSAPRRTVTPARRAGVLMRFKAVRTQGALVKIIQESGEPVPAGAMISLRGESFPIAGNGEAWVTGLDAEADATVAWHGGRCMVHIPLADSTRARPRIGPLTCKGAGA